MSQRSYALCGLAAPVIFVSAIVVFAALRPDYSHLTNAVSELGVFDAPHALAWNLIGFILVGLLIALFGAGLGRATSASGGIDSAGLWLIVSGLGFAGAGAFPANMEARFASPWTILHLVMSTVCFVTFIVAAFAFGKRFSRLPAWTGMARISSGTAWLAIASMLLRAMPLMPGVMQRISFGVYLLWVLIMAMALWRRTRSRGVSSVESAARLAQGI